MFKRWCVTLSTRDRKWKQPKHPSTDRQNVTYTHNGTLLGSEKERNSDAMCYDMNESSRTLHQVKQASHTQKYWMSSKFTEAESRKTVSRG